MPRLHVTLLGGFQVRLDAEPAVVLARKKAQALLAYLVVEPGEAHLRDKLAALLWGDSSDQRARQSLRQTLLTLKQALPETEPKLLRVDAEVVAVNRQAVDVDVIALEQLVATATPEALTQAAALCTGDFLEGLGVQEPRFEEWLVRERERLRELALEALARLLAHQTKSGAAQAAIHTAGRLLTLDPLQEAVHRALMRLYAQQGRRGAALRQYQSCVAVLRRELGVEPETATKQLYREILQTEAVPSAVASPSELSETLVVQHSADARAEASVPTTPLVGRETQMAALARVRTGAWRGQARIAVILGEAGIGKSRLIDALVADSVAHGGRALVGRAHDSERILPFGPWVDAFRSAGVIPGLARQPGLSAPWRVQLARLFPELGEPGRERVAAEEEDQVRLFEAMAQAVGHLAERQPLLLVLEDLHWADDMSLRLLAFLSRRGAAWPVLLVATIRTEEVIDAPAVTRLLRELSNDQHFLSLTLAPLSAADTVTLVRLLGRVGTDEPAVQRLSTQIWRASEGNPFMVVETMRSLDGAASLDVADKLPTPPRVRDTIAARLDRLSPRGRDLTALASVIGREFDFALLERAAGADGQETAATVEELVARHVLHAVDERLDFTHDRIREVAYEHLLAPRRKLLHAAVANALEAVYANDLAPRERADLPAGVAQHLVPTQGTDLGPRLAEVAHHCFLSLPGGDAQRAAHFGLLAGRCAAVALAYADAATWYTRALHALSGAGDPHPRKALDLLLALGEARARAGEPTAAREAFISAADLARALGAVELLASAALGLAGGADVTSRVDAATIDLLEEALAACGASDGPARARLLSRLATALYFSDATERRAGLSRQAVEIAERLGDPVTLALVLHNAHFAVLGPDSLDERTAMASRIIALGEATGRKDLAFAGHYWQLVDALELGDIAVVDASQRRHAELAEELGQPFHRWRARVLTAMRAVLAGRLADAERLIDEALQVGQCASPNALLVYGVQLFGLRREQGRLDEMESAISAFAEEYAAIPAFRSGLALLYCHLGRLDEARAIFDALAIRRFEQFPRDATWLNAMDELAQVCGVLGDHQRAALLYDRLVPYERYNVVIAFAEGCEGSVARYLGLLAATLARWDDAIRHFDAALAMNAALSAWPQVAHTQREYAAMLRARGAPGDAARAAALHAAARAAYDVMGMCSFADLP